MVQEEEEEPNGVEIRLLRVFMGIGSKPKIEVPTYSKSLNREELIDWIHKLDKYFEYKEVVEEK